MCVHFSLYQIISWTIGEILLWLSAIIFVFYSLFFLFFSLFLCIFLIIHFFLLYFLCAQFVSLPPCHFPVPTLYLSLVSSLIHKMPQSRTKTWSGSLIPFRSWTKAAKRVKRSLRASVPQSELTTPAQHARCCQSSVRKVAIGRPKIN